MKHSVAWRLLEVAKHGDYHDRIKAVRQLARIDHLKGIEMQIALILSDFIMGWTLSLALNVFYFSNRFDLLRIRLGLSALGANVQWAHSNLTGSTLFRHSMVSATTKFWRSASTKIADLRHSFASKSIASA